MLPCLVLAPQRRLRCMGNLPLRGVVPQVLTDPLPPADFLDALRRCVVTGARGPRSRVHLGSPSGPVLVDASIQPLLDGARALLCRGITGDVELWDNERPFPRMRGKIEELSKWRVKENSSVSPTFVPYEPIPDTGCRLRWAKRKHRQASHTHLAEVARRQCFCQGVFTRPRSKAELSYHVDLRLPSRPLLNCEYMVSSN